MNPDVLIVGAGIFGVTAALELRKRGHTVRVVAPGPIPHPLAASTDISKVVRMEYGTDDQYMSMVETSIPGFVAWNQELGEALYHNTGVTAFTIEPMTPGGFEYDSLQTLVRHGLSPERLSADDIAERFPAWNPERYVDGFYHALGGYVESGRLIAALVAQARSSGVFFLEDQVVEVGAGWVVTKSAQRFEAGLVVVAAGAWSPLLVPELAPYMKSTGHPVFHLVPEDPSLFTPPRFCTFMGDVARTGWYGFPYNPREGVVKVANHGVGRSVHPDLGEREVYKADEEALRQFLHQAFPGLADAEVVYTRRCLYNDTLDEHLWIDHHPDRPGLFVATGGSGHGMKFAPVLGPLIADAVEGKANLWLERFRWRHLTAATKGQEAARHHA